MKLTVKSLPQILFAHIYSATNYQTIIHPAPNCFEIFYIKHGELTIFEKEKSITVGENCIFCLSYPNWYKISSFGNHEHHTISFRMDYSSGPDADLDIPVTLSAQSFNKPVRELIDKIIYMQTLYNQHRVIISGLILELLGEINKTLQVQNSINNKKSRYSSIFYVEKAKNYIFEHINKPIVQKDIAKYLGVTPNYLCKIFRETTGSNLIHYINEIKLEKIKTLMLDDRLKLADIYQSYGFTDPNYVSKLFKKYYGINLSNYLQANIRNTDDKN